MFLCVPTECQRDCISLNSCENHNKVQLFDVAFGAVLSSHFAATTTAAAADELSESHPAVKSIGESSNPNECSAHDRQMAHSTIRAAAIERRPDQPRYAIIAGNAVCQFEWRHAALL